MKIVHSFWSKPSMNMKSNSNLAYGGWRHLKYHYMSWALSCLTFKKLYDNIELITDIKGYKLFIEKLNLPYTSVKVELDCLNKYPAKLWAIGKIYSYQIQEDPFIHVDGDVYLWQCFGPELENADLIAQQKDIDDGHYYTALDEIRLNKFNLPKVIIDEIINCNLIESCNAGIFGGNDIDFIKSYCEEAFKFINSNYNKYHIDFNSTSYALVYEQYLFSCMARKAKKKISYYLDYNLKQRDNFLHGDISTFLNKYNSEQRFVHLLSSKKSVIRACYELENQLQLEFPNHYELILKCFP